jgi:hypothetical protein
MLNINKVKSIILLLAGAGMLFANSGLTSNKVTQTTYNIDNTNIVMMPEIVVTAPRNASNENISYVKMPDIVVTAKRPSRLTYTALLIKRKLANALNTNNHEFDYEKRYAKIGLQPVSYKTKIDIEKDFTNVKAVSGSYYLAKNDTLKDDLKISGGVANVEGLVDGDLAVMGGKANISGGVTGDVAVFGGNIDLSGKIGGDMAVFGGGLDNKGTVKGDIFVAGGNIKLDSGSVVEGAISMVGGNVSRDTNAIVKGEIKSVEISKLNKALPKLAQIFRFSRFSNLPGLHFARSLINLAALIVLLILQLLIMLIFPGSVERIGERVQKNVWLSVAFGLGIEILFIPVIMLLAVSLVGIPIIPIFILCVFVAVLFGFTCLCYLIGNRIKNNSGMETSNQSSRIGSFLLGWIVIMIIPIIGSFLRAVTVLGWPVYGLGILIRYVAYTIGLGAVFYTLVTHKKQ